MDWLLNKSELASFLEIQNSFLSDGLEMDLMAKSGLEVIKVIIIVAVKVTIRLVVHSLGTIIDQLKF